jgi:hypothetical protein
VEEGQFGLIGISPSTIIPWLLGGLLLLVVLTMSITVKSWRESKRYPYFFLRVQASKRMQRYLAGSLLLILITAITAAYAWQTPEDTTTRLAPLSHAKVSNQAVSAAEQGDSLADAAPASVEISTVTAFSKSSSSDSEAPLLDPVILPEKYDQVEPASDLSAGTTIGPILFSTDISDDYDAVAASTRFGKGYFTLYATFDYEEMANGLSWSWVWRRNGEVIEGGNQSWLYGENGPGYVYFRPESGFDLGNYTLEVWVNGDLMAQSSFTVTDAISANN